MKNIQNDIAIITGAGSGIGNAVARQLAECGVRVVLFDINEENLNASVNRINEKFDGLAFAKHVDISDEQSVNESVKWVVATLGVPSMLCNSAAVQRFGRTESFSFEHWKRVIDINLNGTFLMCKALLPHIASSKGTIVNVASLAGNFGIPYDAAYSASKGGVITMTKALAKEYADRDIKITAIAPGAVDTPMLAMAPPQDINADVLKVIPRSARNPSSADDIAKLVVFLYRDAPYSMTGSVVSIDGAAG